MFGKRLRPRGLLLLAAVVVLVASAMAVAVWLPRSESAEDWLKPGKLAQAEPVWAEAIAVDEVRIAGDVLLRMVFGKDEDKEPSSVEEATVYAHDLATGEELWTGEDVDQAWVSGDMVVFTKRQSATFTVRDLHSGDEITQTTVEEPGKGSIDFPTVVGDVLLYSTGYVRDDVENVTELVGVDITSGDELWRRDKVGVRGAGNFYPLRAADAHVDTTDIKDKLHTSVDVSYAVRRAGTRWGARLLDVETGKDLPKKQGGETFDLSIHATVVTKDGALYTEIDGRRKNSADSYVVDVEAGKQKRYPITEHWAQAGDGLPRGKEVPWVVGNDLFTVDAESRVKVIDTATGKTRWRSTGMARPVAYGSGTVLEKVFADNTTGVRATDIESGKTLWTRDGMPTGVQEDDIPTIAGGELITGTPVNQTGKEAIGEEFRTTQVFDLKTGEGKWQVNESTLLDFNDDYYVFSIRKTNGTTVAAVKRD
ncbi:MAG: PQQ-binding-like beta-propeller repeat protein [Stackebrandtia sp.]